MKRLTVLFFLLFLNFFTVNFFYNNVHAATSNSPNPTSAGLVQPQPSPSSSLVNVPGMTCGNAVSPDADAKKCCPKNEIVPNDAGLIDQLKNAPGIGPILSYIVDPFNNVKSAILQLQRNTSPIPCVLGYPSITDQNDPSCVCLQAITPSPIQELNRMCDRYFSGSAELGSCKSCADSAGVWTGLGCIYGDTGKFIRETVFGLAIGLAGLIALICIIYSAFSLQISQGNPEKIKKAQELLTSCIMGLMLIIFSVFILKLIGVNILKIPGFG